MRNRTRFTSTVFAGTLAGLLLLAGCSPKVGAALTADELSAALPAGTPYAVVHLYRPDKLAGFAIGYDVRVNDTVAYRARNGSRFDLRRSKPGTITLSAKTEAREEINLTVEAGREYYISCTIGMGALVGRLHFAQVGTAQGSKEMASIAPPK